MKKNFISQFYFIGDQNSVKYSYDNAKLTMIFTAMQGGITR